MKPWFRIAASLVTLAACAFFLWNLIGSAREIGTLVRDMPLAKVVPAFIASALLFVTIYPLTGYMFPALLSSEGARLSRSASIGILATSQLARYLPGNVGQHIARGGMLTSRGFTMSAIVPALMIEALLSVMAACFVACVALLLFPPRIALPVGWPVLLGILAFGFLALPLLRLWPGIADRLGQRFGTLYRSLLVSPSLALRCVGVYALNYIFVGAGLYLIARAIQPDPGPAGLFMGAFALSWIVGFLAPGLPAGLGVREGILVALLEPTLGTTGAVTLAALHRLSTTVGDALAAALGAALLWRVRKTS